MDGQHPEHAGMLAGRTAAVGEACNSSSLFDARARRLLFCLAEWPLKFGLRGLNIGDMSDHLFRLFR